MLAASTGFSYVQADTGPDRRHFLMDPTEKHIPAEALLIRRARQALGLSPERIVERLTRVKMSSRNWRLIEDGRTAPDDTIAHMAHAAEVDPDRLAEARPEAAEILREIQRQEATTETPQPAEGELTREQLIAEARKLNAQAVELTAKADEYL